MAEAAVPVSPVTDVAPQTADRSVGLGMTLLAMAWRNLWRNGRRTWLSAGGVAFSVFIMVFAWAAQIGTFGIMMSNATGLMTGHLQIAHVDYPDDPALRHTVTGTAALTTALLARPEVEVATTRGLAFGLISHDERSFGGQVMGVDPAAERELSSLHRRITSGRYLRGTGEAILGVILARNLGLAVGDEAVVLGTGKEGGVAALAVRVVGIFTTDIAAVDRSLMQVHIADFRDGFYLGDEGHQVVIRLHDMDAAAGLRDELGALATGPTVTRTWTELLPELQQLVDMKKAGQQVFFLLLGIMVTFTTFNTFAMTVYERTREFGMLLAMGLRPGAIVLMLQVEALYLSLLGIGLGLGLSAALVLSLGTTGIPLGDQLGEMMRQYQLPDRMYPALTVSGTVPPALAMFIALQVAALIPVMRIRRLRPVDAMRMGA